MAVHKGIPFGMVALGIVALALGYAPARNSTAQSITAPKVFVTRVLIRDLADYSFRFRIEINAYNPNGAPLDMDVSLEVLAKNSSTDTRKITFGTLREADFEPVSWDREFRRTDAGSIFLYPGRYHPLRFEGVLRTTVPPDLRPEGKEWIFPYIYEGRFSGSEEPMGRIEVTITGLASFDGHPDMSVPIQETISVPYPPTE